MNTSRTFYNIIALAKEDQSDIAAVAKRQEWMRNGNKWDDIIQGRELPHNTKYMVVDLETHDWKCNDPLLAQFSCPKQRLTQLRDARKTTNILNLIYFFMNTF